MSSCAAPYPSFNQRSGGPLLQGRNTNHDLLRYGVPVKIEAGKVTETVHLINWQEPEKNDFAFAEEVTLKGNHERRPDIVLYVKGIAIGARSIRGLMKMSGKSPLGSPHPSAAIMTTKAKWAAFEWVVMLEPAAGQS